MPRTLDYQTPRRSSPPPKLPAKDFWIPIGLLALGFLILAAEAHHASNFFRTFGVVMSALTVAVGVETLFAVLAAIVAASLLGISFGEVGTAVLKLAGIIAFTGAIGSLMPFLFGLIIVLSVYAGLVMFLFELDWSEARIFTGIYLLVRVVAAILIVNMV